MDAILAIAPCDPCVIERSNGDLLYELTPREWPIFTQSIHPNSQGVRFTSSNDAIRRMRLNLSVKNIQQGASNALICKKEPSVDARLRGTLLRSPCWQSDAS